MAKNINVNHRSSQAPCYTHFVLGKNIVVQGSYFVVFCLTVLFIKVSWVEIVASINRLYIGALGFRTQH